VVLVIKEIKTRVFYAPIGEVDISSPIHPSERYSEILGCKSEKTRREKYLVWKLLERAVEKYLNLDFANIKFTKTANGKWICPDFCFSLSHTDTLVAVAISNAPIGVDTEEVRPIKEVLADKILTESEKESFSTLPLEKRGKYLLEAWVKKESIFKAKDQKALLPTHTETQNSNVVVRYFTLLGREYILSVATECEIIETVYMEEL